jgi:HSP20 family protein
MNLMPWRRQTPISNLSTLQQEMNRMFEDAFAPFSRFSESQQVMLPVDIKEDEKSLTVTAELPGVDKKNVHIDIRDNILTIKGEKHSEKREDKDNWHSIERSYGSFSRRVMLPCDVDDSQADASMDKGVLTLKLPKATGTSPKSIPVH